MGRGAEGKEKRGTGVKEGLATRKVRREEETSTDENAIQGRGEKRSTEPGLVKDVRTCLFWKLHEMGDLRSEAGFLEGTSTSFGELGHN